MKRIFLAISLIVVIVAVMLAFAPLLMKNYFNDNAEALIGRPAYLEKLYFNPFRCSLTAENLKVREQDGATLFAGFQTLYINLNLWRTITGPVQVEEVSIDSLYVVVINADGRFNFSDLLPEEDSTRASIADDETIEFEILNFSLHNGQMTYYEKALDHEIIFDDLSFVLPRFAWNSRSANMDAELVINETGSLALRNEYFPNESRLISHIKLRGLDMDISKPYAQAYHAFRDYSGLAHGDITIRGSFADTTRMEVEGEAWLTEVQVLDSATTPILAIDSLGLRIAGLDPLANDFKFEKMLIDGLFLRFDLMDSSNNWYQALAPVLPEQEEAADSVAAVGEDASVAYAYSIDTVLVLHSAIHYRDYSLNNFFEYKISDITALGNGIRSDSSLARFSSSGILNEKGRYDANLVLSPVNPLDFTLDFAVEGFQVADISPFTLHYAGHPIFEGELIYSGTTTVKNNVMESDNKITIHDLTVGKRASKNVLYAMPLRFAVFLLKDKEGIVNLDLPMDGNINDPNFRVGPLVWQILKQNMEKIVAAPGKLFASMFGVKEEDIEYLPFAALDTTLAEEATQGAAALLKLVQEKPGLAVELTYQQPIGSEKEQMALWLAKQKYVAGTMPSASAATGIEELAAKVDDTDIHFITFLNDTLPNAAQVADSLALALVGMEAVLQGMEELERSRQQQIVRHIHAQDSNAVKHFHFLPAVHEQHGAATQNGFSVSFAMDDDEDDDAAKPSEE
jgi:hypothetical protein